MDQKKLEAIATRAAELSVMKLHDLRCYYLDEPITVSPKKAEELAEGVDRKIMIYLLLIAEFTEKTVDPIPDIYLSDGRGNYVTETGSITKDLTKALRFNNASSAVKWRAGKWRSLQGGWFVYKKKKQPITNGDK